ncbi:MAG: biotin transporter BioY [Clostridia bacterium]|nr:biotin transporter BioY [Clostridia bacterium]
MFTAIMAVASQISIPMPSAVPVTIQSLVVAFAGYYLGTRRALLSIVLYIFLGAVGAPVFASLKGGFYVLLGPTGGFIWGFVFVAFLCSLFVNAKLAIPCGIFSILLCHVIGIVQYAIVMKTNPLVPILTISLPYLIKDIIFVIIAYFLSIKMKKRIKP